jgi:hypothetical protein
MPCVVLIVDDATELAELAWAHYLRSLGYVIQAIVATGEEALELAKVDPPDVAIVDITLGSDMSGVETAAHLLARHSVRIVFCSAYERGVAPDLDLLTAGFVYLEKPFSLEDLGAAVGAAAQTKTASATEGDSDLLRRLNSKADLISVQMETARRRVREKRA